MISRRAAWYALGVLAFANLVNYGLRNSFQPLYPELRAKFGFTDGELGFIGFTYMFAHAAATLPMGWAGDRFDRRRLIALGMGLASIGAAAAAVAGHVASLAAARAISGLGTAAVVPVANSILGEAFDGPKKAIALALFNLGLILGGVAGFGVGAGLGFPGAFYAFAIPAAILVGVIAILPVAPKRTGAAASGGARAFLADARELLSIRPLRWLAASSTAMAFATGGYLGWLLDFLQTERHMSKESATQVLGVSIIGALAGVITGGRIGDRLRVRHRAGRLYAIVLGLGLTVPCAIVCIEAQPGPLLYVGAVLTMFFVSWYHGPIAASVDDLATGGRAATAQSLVIFSMHALGTAPGWWLIGIVAGRTSLTTAMLANTGMVVVAVLLMIRAGRVYGSAPPAAL
ncbi:MAG TPA: MFS transporter [Kofleriaceae bacterium]|nr:MFS transporter [Kofleriaceae bacterium]